MKLFHLAYEYQMPDYPDSIRCTAARRRARLGALVTLMSIVALASCDARIGGPAGGPLAPLVPDAAVADAAPTPDATPTPDAPPQTCEQIYGMAIEYHLCEERADTCEFSVRTNGGDCDQLCGNFGGTCIEAYDNQGGDAERCDRVEKSGDDCTTDRSTEICICNRY